MRKIVLATLLLFAIGLEAQISQWRIHPKYSRIDMLGNGLYVITENGKCGIMNAQEKEILPMQYDYIGEFESHYAIVINNGQFVAYVSDEGKLKDVSKEHYDIQGDGLFHDGYLLVRNQTGYYYLRGSDDKVIGPFKDGTLFTEGFASVKVPKNPKHILDGDYIPHLLSAQTGLLEKLNLGEYDADDVDFISSVSNGKVIIALKKRFYELDIRNGALVPLSTDGNIENKKSRVIANERPVNVGTTESGYSILTKQGEMTFDHLMRLNGINYIGQEFRNVSVPEKKAVVKKSNIQCMEKDGLFSLFYNGKEILLPQFEKVGLAWNDEVMVMVNGKYGVLAIDPNHSCRFVLNDNLAVGFEHKSANTNIKAVCPPYMKPMLMKLTSLDDSKCHINTDTRKENTNVETAVLSYECSLAITDEITLDKQPVYATFALNYDGLKYTPNKISFDTWYINNYNVQILKHQMEGTLLTADVLVSSKSTNGRNYFKEVSIEAEDSVIASITKVTEDIYNAKFYGFKNSNVRFSVDVTEDGCPTLSYDFSIPTSVSTASKSKEAKEPEQEKTVSTGKIKKSSKPKSGGKQPEKKKEVFIAF